MELEGFCLDVELWEQFRAVAYRMGISPSQFLVEAFQTEKDRLNALFKSGKPHPLGDRANSLDALAELAVKNAIADFLARNGSVEL